MTRDDIMRETLAHVRRVGNLMLDVTEKLNRRAMQHDDSKFSEQEFPAFAAETPNLRSLTYGSDEYKEALKRLGPALSNHYKNNRHHPEYFGNTSCDQCGNEENNPCSCGGSRTQRGNISEMDLLDLIEMLADWKAATERHADGNLRNSIRQNQNRFGYSDEMFNLLTQTANRLGWLKE